MHKLEFCQNFIFLKKKPISFAGRPYLLAPYNSQARRLVIRASRQVEKSTFLVNTIVYTAVQRPETRILFVCPRQEQARVFARSRLLNTIMESPIIRRHLLGKGRQKPQVTHLRFLNGSEVYIRAAYHSGDAVRGIDADMLLIDEFQDVADGDLPVLEETLSHSAYRRVILTGTPKSIDNHLEGVFSKSTACEWRVPCPNCAQEAVLDDRCLGPTGVLPSDCTQAAILNDPYFEPTGVTFPDGTQDVILDDRCLGPTGATCPNCQESLNPQAGHWVARHPDAVWGEGYWINHLMVPWVNYSELLEHQQTYDPALFKNECLGMPTVLGDHLVTRAEVEACCGSNAMIQQIEQIPPGAHNCLVAGIDWGGGGVSRTVLVLGYMRDDDCFVVLRLERFPAREEPNQVLAAVAQRCRQFGVRALAADGGGNGSVYNSLLLDQLPQLAILFAMLYSAADHPPQVYRGRLSNWTIARTPSLGAVFSRVKKHKIEFPRLQECGSFLDEIYCETAEYDDHNRSIKYLHPETQPDDTLHAVNYAAVLGRRVLDRSFRFQGNQ
jgi:hypothetical protein